MSAKEDAICERGRQFWSSKITQPPRGVDPQRNTQMYFRISSPGSQQYPWYTAYLQKRVASNGTCTKGRRRGESAVSPDSGSTLHCRFGIPSLRMHPKYLYRLWFGRVSESSKFGFFHKAIKSVVQTFIAEWLPLYSFLKFS